MGAVGKTGFEQLCWNLAGMMVKNFHSDNGVYDASVFRDDCISKDQSQTFLVSERNIKMQFQTVCYWAHHMMVHGAVCWPSNISLWPFAIQHSVWLFNHIPNWVTGLTPLKVFTKTKSDHQELQGAHVWGYPIFCAGPLSPRWQEDSKVESLCLPCTVCWVLA